MVFARISSRGLLLTSFAVVVLASCKRHDDSPPAQAYPQQPYPQYPQGYPQQSYPQGYPQQPYPQGYPQQQPAAFGFFCASDFDLQCPYGRCLGGRCGGCVDASQCKPGATCAPSPVGGACWPGSANNVPPPAPPAPAPPPPAPGPTPSQPPPFQPPPASQDPFAAARQSCVDRINQYRARVRVSPVSRDPSSEACDDEESRLDARSNRPHGSFGKCGERAQNACPNYPGASVEDVLTRCLQQMFDEGPGGGHYDNMTSTKYSRASCGFEAMPGGRIWTVQNFFK
jgi:hypothetical protein